MIVAAPLWPSLPTASGDIDGALLQDTQAYLRDQRQQRSSAPRLLSAWLRFYDEVAPRIRRYAAGCRVPPSDLDDCAQQVWTELCRKLPDFHFDPKRGRFCSWLFTLVHSRAVDLLRQSGRQPGTGLSERLAAVAATQEADPARMCERSSERSLVHEMLAELERRASGRSYRVLYMRWIQGRTVSEVAVALGLTAQQVRFRCHRMKEKLRLLFAPDKYAGATCRQVVRITDS